MKKCALYTRVSTSMQAEQVKKAYGMAVFLKKAPFDPPRSHNFLYMCR